MMNAIAVFYETYQIFYLSKCQNRNQEIRFHSSWNAVKVHDNALYLIPRLVMSPKP